MSQSLGFVPVSDHGYYALVELERSDGVHYLPKYTHTIARHRVFWSVWTCDHMRIFNEKICEKVKARNGTGRLFDQCSSHISGH